MITVERLDKIEQDLKWAHENADRSAQTRLFIHHVPFLLTILRPVAEAIEAERLEEEEYLAEEGEFEYRTAPESEEETIEDAADSESETETVGLVSKVKEFLSPSDDDGTDIQLDAREDGPELVDANEATDAPEGAEQDSVAEPGSPTALAEGVPDSQPEPFPPDEDIKSS